MNRRTAFALAATLCLGAILAALPEPAGAQVRKVHALSLVGDPKYAADFKALDYVNPDAPKGGELRLLDIGGFDSLNPFIPKGEPASGLGLVFEQLMASPMDDIAAEYGLIAESVEVPDDLSHVIFNLRSIARWHDGTPITADDVVFSFDVQKAKGAPQTRLYYANVTRAEKLGALRVKFHFSGPKNRELPQIMGQLSIIQKAYWEKRDFEKTTLEPWPGSGPYRIKEVEPNRSITYERVNDWWARDLPIMRGRYNFDRVRFDSYRDETVALEAFKSGQYDYRSERIARVWATGYDFPAMKQGQVIKAEMPHERPTGLSGFVFNTRKARLGDVRVREALALAFDFEWANKNFFYGQYARSNSFFENSEFAARGLPSPAERALLEPFRAQLPKSVFETEFKSPVSDGSGADRNNLRRARELLAEAGYTVKDRKLVGPDGQAFTLEFLGADPSFERIVAAWKANLERLGVDLVIRNVDTAQYTNRVRAFEFDVIFSGWGQSNSPGNEQRNYWTSAAADSPNSQNTAGIKSPVIDKLVDAVIFAPDRDALVAATRALDRVLLSGHYLVPGWSLRMDRIAYWNKFGFTGRIPRYGNDLFAWWIDPAKDAALKARAAPRP